MRHAVLTLLLATTVVGQSGIPETPAGRVFTAWLAAFGSADLATLNRFDETYPGHTPPLGQRLNYSEQTGGFTVLRIEKSEPLSVVALVEEKNSDTMFRLELSVSSEGPPTIVNSTLQYVFSRPAEFAIPRMTEAEAVAALSARVDGRVMSDMFSGAVLVARDGQVLLQKVWGHANREAETPVTRETQFKLASMNKMFTAVAALQLVEADKLTLDDSLRAEHDLRTSWDDIHRFAA